LVHAKLNRAMLKNSMDRRTTDALSEQIVTGAVFAAMRGSLREQAEVIGVTHDSHGIPHVRYHLQLDRAGNHDRVGMRTLALSSFCERYIHRQLESPNKSLA
jgi:hypothetical protein